MLRPRGTKGPTAGLRARQLTDHRVMARTGPDRDAWVALWTIALFLLAALVWLQAPNAG